MSDIRTASREVQADLANQCRRMATLVEARDWAGFLKAFAAFIAQMLPLILPLFLEPGPPAPPVTPPGPVG